MAEIKSSTKGWIIGIAIVALVAIGVFVFMRSTASADIVEIVQGSGYRFEVLSKTNITVENMTSLDSTSSVTNYRVKEPVAINSGFALRARYNGSNQIVNKNIKWIVSNKEGFFSLQPNDALVGVYPATSGTHQISAEIGTGTSKRTIVLSFSTTGYSTSPTPVPTVTSSIAQGITYRQRKGYPRGSFEKVTSVEMQSGETAQLDATWPVVQGVFGTAPVIGNPSLGTVKMTGSGPDGVGFEISGNGGPGETYIEITHGSDKVRLPIKFVMEPSSSIMLLKTLNSSDDRYFFRDNSHTMKTGSNFAIAAYWPNNGVFGEEPKSSNDSVAEAKMTGSGPNGVAVKVTAKSIGTSTITFKHGSDVVTFLVTVTQAATPSVTSTSACTANSTGQLICS